MSIYFFLYSTQSLLFFQIISIIQTLHLLYIFQSLYADWIKRHIPG